MPNTTYSLEEMTQILDHAIEDRAEWFWRLYTAFKEVNPEKAREACEKVILEFGQRKGRKMNLPAAANAQQFIEGVANGPAFYSFDMVYDKLSPDDSGLKFYACPFLEVFEKLGLSKDEQWELCQIANCGDFGMASLFPHLQMEFPEYLSRGDSCCHMRVTAKK